MKCGGIYNGLKIAAIAGTAGFLIDEFNCPKLFQQPQKAI